LKIIKDNIRKAIRSLGFDLYRFNPGTSPSLQLVKAFSRFEVDLVLDVGANVGQFASALRIFGYKGKLVSFEPLVMEHRILSETACRDPSWQVHTRCAIGDFDGKAEINVSGNSVSSSLLPMLNMHSSAAKDSAYVGIEETPIFKLDTVALNYLEGANSIFLKIDTQGFEWNVIEGAKQILPHVQGVLCEMSMIPLYEGQHLWREMIQRIESLGFTLWAILPGFVDSRDGKTLQFDAVFFRL
jgi:FkbM family methyltransferase